eukprot:CAMPEP_0174921764 /NCGR_PEP_ID=MMETSP1355-20121228/5392_1 /TAXON_ID=464990 /ORGANISM="Hemiselmis tepida, Strain CCMP443" /LENGTH=45 /DNA_ID= /DNA_START= /DNA_END= /DNA_ORIENTATION=
MKEPVDQVETGMDGGLLTQESVCQSPGLALRFSCELQRSKQPPPP